ncbi:MAG: Formamidopyrimidine-DNA glycosylase, partial [uncultured Solirubrobacterales bacterium]
HASRQGADAAQGPRPPGRGLPALRHDARGRVLQGPRDDLLPHRADGRTGAEGPAPLATAAL